MQPDSSRIQYQGQSLDDWKTQVRDPNATVRLRAAEAIGRIGPAAIPTLIEMLRHDDPSVRYWAAKGLGNAGQGSAPAAEALRSAMKNDASGTVRGMAAEARYRIGEREAGLEGLIAALKDPNPAVQLRAGNFLRLVGPEAKKAIPALKEAGDATKDDYVSRIVEGALKAIQE